MGIPDRSGSLPAGAHRHPQYRTAGNKPRPRNILKLPLLAVRGTEKCLLFHAVLVDSDSTRDASAGKVISVTLKQMKAVNSNDGV